MDREGEREREREGERRVLTSDLLGLFKDLRTVAVLLGRHVSGLFQQWHVYDGGGVAHGARVSVPVVVVVVVFQRVVVLFGWLNVCDVWEGWMV